MSNPKTQKMRVSCNFFERHAWESKKLVCGIDEVGRGPLAGPLVVGAVILPPNSRYSLLKDSKKLTEKQREQAFCWIKKRCVWATSIVSWQDIDRLNVYQATRLAMKKALLGVLFGLGPKRTELKYVVVDAVPLEVSNIELPPGVELHHFVRGEDSSKSIAAASIVAKVTRDRLMTKLGRLFPALKLHSNKGYGTAEHLKEIVKHGQMLIHRKSFLKTVLAKNNLETKQETFI